MFQIPDETPVSSIFVDESGSKNSKGSFFVLGFVKARDTALLDREIRRIRQKHKFYDEMKFTRINRHCSEFYADIIEKLANSDVRIGGTIFDSTKSFPTESKSWEIQASYAATLVRGNINKGEVVNAFFDLVDTPASISLADMVSTEVNKRLSCRAVVGAYDMDSRAHNLLQVADLVAGCIRVDARNSGKTNGSSGKVKDYITCRLKHAFLVDRLDASVQGGKVNIIARQ